MFAIGKIASPNQARSPTAKTQIRTRPTKNDGIEAKPYTVAIDLYIQGDELVADYSRSSPQARGPVSATLGVATGAVYNGMLHVTDPTIPKNSGCFRPIRVVSPPGRVTNVDYPNPLVAGNTETHPRLANIVIGATPAFAFEAAKVEVPPGSRLYVFSDGIFEFEGKDGKQWGLDLVLPLIVEPPVAGMTEPERLLRDIRARSRDPDFDDDFTVVVATFL